MKAHWLTNCSLCGKSFNKTRYGFAKIEDKEYCSGVCLYHAMDRFDYQEKKRKKEKNLRTLLIILSCIAWILIIFSFIK